MQPALLQLHPGIQLSLQRGLCCCYFAAPERHVAELLAAAGPVTQPGGFPHQAAQHFTSDNACMKLVQSKTYLLAAATPGTSTCYSHLFVRA